MGRETVVTYSSKGPAKASPDPGNARATNATLKEGGFITRVLTPSACYHHTELRHSAWAKQTPQQQSKTKHHLTSIKTKKDDNLQLVAAKAHLSLQR